MQEGSGNDSAPSRRYPSGCDTELGAIPMVGEILAGLSGFKALYDAAKALKDMNDATIRNAAVIELQEKILAAREAQSALLERVSDLEKEVASFEAWNAQSKRYELKELGSGSLAYMLKRDTRDAEPPHWICATCYGQHRVSIIQHTKTPGHGLRYRCPVCNTEIYPSAAAFDQGRNARAMAV